MADKVFPSQTVRSITEADIGDIVLHIRPDGVIDTLEIHYSLHRLDGSTFKNGVYRRSYDSFGAPGKAKLDAVLDDAVTLLQAKVDAATTPDDA